MKVESVIEAMLPIARPEILKEFRADSCIASTAVTIDVLTYFGLLVEPLPVRAMLFNRAFVNRIEAGSPFPKGDEITQWSEEDGSYSIGIGMSGQNLPGRWDGHLVALVEQKYLVDLTLDQADRPKYSMKFSPLSIGVSIEFLEGRNPLVFAQNGCMIRLDVCPHNRGFLKSPDWNERGRRKQIVETIVRKIKESSCSA